ncbi:MAG: MotA/TolQ/ExbB proton channel family protein [Pirellulaceae bacterium]|nr:MotA/TolQ/ExbB proton channel family protein [Planctomycetaceae bacterium]
MDLGILTGIVAQLAYLALASLALWGAFCIIMIWTRVGQKRFKNEVVQTEFLDAVDASLSKGRFEEATEICDGDPRAMCQLTWVAITHRRLGFDKVKLLVMDRFQRDILADLEHRLTWVNTVIKSAPMVGLFGTVIGMMGAFDKLASAENVKPDQLASDISVALVTTASGLAIAIPLVICVTMINVRIRKMEDLVSAGLTRFLDSFRTVLK